jgi:hypothetical protein
MSLNRLICTFKIQKREKIAIALTSHPEYLASPQQESIAHSVRLILSEYLHPSYLPVIRRINASQLI